MLRRCHRLVCRLCGAVTSTAKIVRYLAQAARASVWLPWRARAGATRDAGEIGPRLHCNKAGTGKQVGDRTRLVMPVLEQQPPAGMQVLRVVIRRGRGAAGAPPGGA